MYSPLLLQFSMRNNGLKIFIFKAYCFGVGSGQNWLMKWVKKYNFFLSLDILKTASGMKLFRRGDRCLLIFLIVGTLCKTIPDLFWLVKHSAYVFWLVEQWSILIGGAVCLSILIGGAVCLSILIGGAVCLSILIGVAVCWSTYSDWWCSLLIYISWLV